KLKSYELGFVHDQGRSRQEKTSGPTFKREKWPQNLFFVTMTEYKKGLPVSAIAYPPREVRESLAEILSKHKYLQAHLAESEKERMVTFYFDGRRDERFGGEDVEIIASPHVATYDKKPQMSTFKVVNKFKKLLHSNKYHFFVLNFANADMVAHSGNISATIKAIEVVDKSVGDLVNATLERRGTVIITADHGNAEELLSYPSAFYFVTSSSGTINTEHSNNPVPILIISRELEGSPRALGRGTLADIAPTILELMNLPAPQLMTGRNLLARESTLEEAGKDQEHAGMNPA
ncbi:MAG: alkaline phosphatase family protein, partial [Patescibacteria group bacterium]